jgi:ABC-type uncharacterized transport system substrate-binding protein
VLVVANALNLSRTAHCVVTIPNVARSADLSVEQPTKFALAVDLETAKALDIRIPQSTLLRAGEVIR